ncbi:MAG TPA: arsenate reductase (glutaredoxin) [Gammaproteobacteria bacterium]|nr:arsenate reductase (glutaredoxin) [Gammaproteobacteria bacterium]
MKKVTIWHNPGCSKSRATLALLQERDMDIQVREYLTDPPSPAEIERVLGLLHMEPRQLMRSGENAFRDNRADDPRLGRADLVALMHAHPTLIERPVVIVDDDARLGRPPEAVLEIL